MTKQAETGDPSPAAIPFRAGFLVGDLSDPGSLSLAGSRCKACGIALFGERHRCENCSSPDLGHVAFARTGKVHTYTVQRYPPPPPHSLPTSPWQPRPVAWVDLDDSGPRILGPLTCAPEDVAIGMAVRVECSIGWTDAEGRPVIAYGFAPLTAEGPGA